MLVLEEFPLLCNLLLSFFNLSSFEQDSAALWYLQAACRGQCVLGELQGYICADRSVQPLIPYLRTLGGDDSRTSTFSRLFGFTRS